MKNLTSISIFVLLITGCTAQGQRGLNATLYADKTHECTGNNMVFKLEGASAYNKGYIQVNDSGRLETTYQDNGTEAIWWWGGYVVEGSSQLDHSYSKYRIIVEPNGQGAYFKKGSSGTPLTCS